MPFAEIENGRLYYEVSGRGRWLVLIHGAWATHEWWRWQAPTLSQDYRVLTLDVRGHGQSSPLEKAYSVDGFVKDLEALFQHLGINEAALIGWSMGGIISMQHCLDYPEKVKALVLIATRGHRNPQMKRSIRLQQLQARLRLLMELASPRSYDQAVQKPPHPMEWIEKEVSNMLSPVAPKEVFDWVIADLVEHPRENYFEVAKSIWDWGIEERLGSIEMPTLIVVGDKDDRTPPQFSQLLHAKMPSSKLVIVENAGHCVAQERSDIVNGEIIRFLKETGY
ncbi:alpha/beta fold hydrolase [Chloroflexota bacterium]